MESNTLTHRTGKHPFRYLGFRWKFLKPSVESNGDVDDVMFISNKDIIQKMERNFADNKLSELMTKSIEEELRRNREIEASAELETFDGIDEEDYSREEHRSPTPVNSSPRKKSGLFTTQVESPRNPSPPKSPRPSRTNRRQGMIGLRIINEKANSIAIAATTENSRTQTRKETEKEREQRICEQIRV